MTETKKDIERSLLKDWRMVKLGDVCEKMSNGANAKQSDDKIGFPISRIETIWNETIDLGRVKYIEESDATFVEKYSLRKDDILFSHINSDIHLGKTAIFKNQIPTLIHGINLLLIRLNKDAQADFFNYQFRYKRRIGEFISIAQKSVNQSSINQPKLKNLDFVLPPILTQQAIVSKIEELFSELDKGIENLRTAQQQLKTYRQAVLKWAFEGRLTNENVKDSELPKGWKIINLGSVCSLITDGKHGDCNNEENSGFYFLSAKDVRNNTLLWENARQITKMGFEETHRRTNLKPGDICLVNTGATIGRISLAPNNEKTYRSTFQKSVAVIKCIPNLIDNKYCKYLLQGDLKKLVKISSGTAVPNLLLGTLKGHLINLPPSIEEQNKIVEEIENRLSVADKMEESITQSLQQAEGLRQSILKKAFEGKLV